MKEAASILILYDGNCPICVGKTDFLRKRDRKERLAFQDIRDDSFDAAKTGIQTDLLEKQIHAILPNGTVISRMDVIRTAYCEIGLGWLVAPTGWPLLRPLFDTLYNFVANHRLAISRILGKT